MQEPILILLFLLTGLTLHAQKSRLKQEYIQEAASRYGLAAVDVSDYEITDDYVSSETGIRHIYLHQQYLGVRIHNAVMSLHISPEDSLVHVTSRFVARLSDRSTNSLVSVSVRQAFDAALDHLGIILPADAQLTQTGLSGFAGTSDGDIPYSQVYQLGADGHLILCWDFVIDDKSSGDWWDIRVNAGTGEIVDKTNWTIDCTWEHNEFHPVRQSLDEKEEISTSQHEVIYKYEDNALIGAMYHVYPLGIESPGHGNREISMNVEDVTASPFGWHDTTGTPGAEFTITRGNNVHAYEDRDAVDLPGFSPDGGTGLNFDFAIDFGEEPIVNESAIITNMFYWNNLMHDVWYHYGFDEESGNFQANNYGKGGTGDDYVLAEAQDGSETNNARFSTPPDGLHPRMQMFLWNRHSTSPDLDSGLDNGVIAHEYGHGISMRLTGGPSYVNCLDNNEQMGEGWSDWFGLMMTMDASDMGQDGRGIGTYVLGQSSTGNGIREYPYSTDLAINPHTYDSIATSSVPHGVGSVWCAMLWEMTWMLIDEYGFDPDLYAGTGGNNIAMDLVMEGLRLQPCSPGFVDGRDAILAADQMLYDGANQCLIWKAFAKRGLGFSADQGTPYSTFDGVEAFDLPTCLQVTKTVDRLIANPGDTLMYTIEVKSLMSLDTVVLADQLPEHTTYLDGSANNDGVFFGNGVSFPPMDLSAGQDTTFTFKVTVDEDISTSPYTSLDDAETIKNIWIGTSIHESLGNWSVEPGNPHQGSAAWFAPDVSTANQFYLTTAAQVIPGHSSLLKFWHLYDTEETWDGGLVEVSTDNGVSWEDLGDYFVQNGYNSTIDENPDSPAFSGNSGGYVESILDLSSFSNQSILIRFRLHCDQFVGGTGWWIDDIELTDQYVTIPNTVSVSVEDFPSADFFQVIRPTRMSTVYCDDLVVLTDPLDNVTQEFRADHEIQTSSSILNNSMIYLVAADNLRLESGFQVETGSTFFADIGLCDDPPLIGSMTFTSEKSQDRIQVSNARSAQKIILGLNMKRDAQVRIQLIEPDGTSVHDSEPEYSFSAGNHEFAVDTSGLKAGIYLLQIFLNDEQFITRVLID